MRGTKTANDPWVLASQRLLAFVWFVCFFGHAGMSQKEKERKKTVVARRLSWSSWPLAVLCAVATRVTDLHLKLVLACPCFSFDTGRLYRVYMYSVL